MHAHACACLHTCIQTSTTTLQATCTPQAPAQLPPSPPHAFPLTTPPHLSFHTHQPQTAMRQRYSRRLLAGDLLAVANPHSPCPYRPHARLTPIRPARISSPSPLTHTHTILHHGPLTLLPFLRHQPESAMRQRNRTLLLAAALLAVAIFLQPVAAATIQTPNTCAIGGTFYKSGTSCPSNTFDVSLGASVLATRSMAWACYIGWPRGQRGMIRKQGRERERGEEIRVGGGGQGGREAGEEGEAPTPCPTPFIVPGPGFGCGYQDN